MRVLEDQLPRSRHGFNGECWGYDIFPKYSTDREKRAEKWPGAEARHVHKQLAVHDPTQVGPETVQAPKGKHVCAQHQKVKCDNCEKAKSSVKQCCEAHHKADSKLPTRYCEQHRMTKCGTCLDLYRCCGYGHHVCLSHSLKTCTLCLKLANIKEDQEDVV